MPEIDHIDGNPSNNAASNLKWCTHKQNMHNAVTISKMRKFANEKEVSRVRQFALDGTLIKEWRSAREIAIALGVTKERVAYILKRTNQTWRGFKWERVKLTVPRYEAFS